MLRLRSAPCLTTKHEVASTYFGGVAETIDVDTFVPVRFMGDGSDVLTLTEIAYTVRSTGKRFAGQEVHHFTFN